MTRVLAIFVVLFLGYLFYPFWDLFVKADPFADTYSAAGSGFWTYEACAGAAEAQMAENFRCRKRTNFSEFLSTSSHYAQGHGG